MKDSGYERSRQEGLRRIHGAQFERTLEELKEERENRSEKALLPPYASLSSRTLGRQREEDESDNRTQYARDRDRIIYSEAFFRLSGKTQVFLSPNNPLISTRMTHTVQVSQIARSLARALRLNEDLVEAIALGHDLGHPPFGHAGEEVLNRKCLEHGLGGFHHNIQSLHTVDTLERGGKGMNLTWEVREGIVRHDGESDTENITPSEPSGGELWGIDQPRILVSGLNPHAGDGGVIGMEEVEVISPAIVALRSEGFDVEGPIPADTLYCKREGGRQDAFIALYHDQGMIPFKMEGFDRGVNMTIGLPVIRTSVCHGTAYDIVGSGEFSTGSLEAALELASHCCKMKGGAKD